MPFAKTSSGPKAANASPPQPVSSTPTINLQASPDDVDDGSFVETTSSHAAQALAQYWNEVKRQQDANGATSTNGKGAARSHQDGGVQEYVVVARIENGKKIYRIR